MLSASLLEVNKLPFGYGVERAQTVSHIRISGLTWLRGGICVALESVAALLLLQHVGSCTRIERSCMAQRKRLITTLVNHKRQAYVDTT